VRRPFHEAPPAVRDLLLRDGRLAAEHAWLFDVGGLTAPTLPPVQPDGRGDSTDISSTRPVEALTDKEREVLGHLAELLSTQEIAAVMYVSVNTVRTHVRNILRKLGVNSRNTAVRVARELELLPRLVDAPPRPKPPAAPADGGIPDDGSPHASAPG
jgi:LuxR family transcriptional regulator, maltose regulon positive regulatory protein